MSKKEIKKIDVAQGFEELEAIAEWFEKGDGQLDEGLKKFERAMEIADVLKKRLDEAENTIKEIKEKYETESF